MNLLRFLKGKGIIDDNQIEKILSHQNSYGGTVSDVLLSLGYLSDLDHITEMSELHGLDIVKIKDILIDTNLFNRFSESFLKENFFIPFKYSEGIMHVAINDPNNILILDGIKDEFKCLIKFYLCLKGDILDFLNGFYLQKEVKETYVKLKEDSDLVVEESSLIIDIINNILIDGIKQKASDIHIGLVDGKVLIRFRKDGLLQEYESYDSEIFRNLVSRIKTVSKLNVTEFNTFQNGRINRFIDGTEVDMRVSTLPTIYGEKIVIRILDKRSLFSTIDELGFNDNSKLIYNDLIDHSYGMILITGPTGSGKTSTLYTTISELFDISKNIITIEDPVEYILKGIEQVQINKKSDITFSGGLKSILRQDPDIIMVGEIRDSDTAQIATRAALTGHLVFSTLHTKDCISSITRLVDMGVESYLVASTIIGVVNQRLVRKLCDKCKVLECNSSVKEALNYFGIEEFFPCYKSVGCEVCDFTGYKGRLALHEILKIDESIKKGIVDRLSDSEMFEIAKSNPSIFISLKEDGIHKLQLGLTSFEELKKNIR